MDIAAIAARAPVIPVLTIERLADAVPLARALVKGGLPVLEITFRTGVAVEALAAIAREVPEAIVGAGTVLDERQLRQAIDAGARFGVSPGCTAALAAGGDGIRPAVPAGRADRVGGPGGARAGLRPAEVLPGRYRGRHGLAQGGGGARWPACGSARPAGSALDAAPAYLALANVACVGGSWVAPRDAVAAGDWSRIEHLASQAAALKRS